MHILHPSTRVKRTDILNELAFKLTSTAASSFQEISEFSTTISKMSSDEDRAKEILKGFKLYPFRECLYV